MRLSPTMNQRNADPRHAAECRGGLRPPDADIGEVGPGFVVTGGERWLTDCRERDDRTEQQDEGAQTDYCGDAGEPDPRVRTGARGHADAVKINSVAVDSGPSIRRQCPQSP